MDLIKKSLFIDTTVNNINSEMNNNNSTNSNDSKTSLEVKTDTIDNVTNVTNVTNSLVMKSKIDKCAVDNVNCVVGEFIPKNEKSVTTSVGGDSHNFDDDNDDDDWVKFDVFSAEARFRKQKENEIDQKFTLLKLECIEKIKQDIERMEHESIFLISNDEDDAVCDAFLKYFKHDLKFTVILPLVYKEKHKNEYTLKWITDETRGMNDVQMKSNRDRLEVMGEKFSVYHAMMFAEEQRKKYHETLLKRLLKKCIKLIADTIDEKKTSFIFRIPYEEFKVEKESDRNIIYERLIEELKKKKFHVTEKLFTTYSMKIHCLPQPTITMERADGKNERENLNFASLSKAIVVDEKNPRKSFEEMVKRLINLAQSVTEMDYQIRFGNLAGNTQQVQSSMNQLNLIRQYQTETLDLIFKTFDNLYLKSLSKD